jgi:hypothetical protein
MSVGCGSCSPIRGYSVVIPASLRGSWVVIERDNPKCPALKRGAFSSEVEIPSDGYLCTSTAQESGWLVASYFARENAKLARLNDDTEILREGSLEVRAKGCQIRAEVFFFGERSELRQSQISPEDVLKKHHPSCFD